MASTDPSRHFQAAGRHIVSVNINIHLEIESAFGELSEGMGIVKLSGRGRGPSASAVNRDRGKFGLIETTSLSFLYEMMCGSCRFKPFNFAPD